MSIDVKAGMFHLVREMSRDTIKSALNRAEGYLAEFGGYPSTGLYNVMGVLQYKLGEEKENQKKATDSFGKALDKDPFNLNAWENSRIAYESLGLTCDAERCSDKVRELLAEDTRDGKAWKVRCLAEQGLAHTFNFRGHQTGMELAGDDMARQLVAKMYLEKALRINEENQALLQPEETYQWRFFLSQCLHGLFGHYYRLGQSTNQIFVQGTSILAEIAKNSEDVKYRAKALALLGTIASKEPGGSWREQARATDNLAYEDLEDCFRQACELLPRDFKVRNRYARFLKNIGQDRLIDAKEVLCESIKICSNPSENWFAFHSRGDIKKKLFLSLRDKERAGDTLLQEALTDLRTASTHPNQNVKINLGEVLDLLGRPAEAIKEFQKVLDHLDGQRISWLHRKMGECFLNLQNNTAQNIRRAAESFKQAFESSEREKYVSTNVLSVLETIAKMWKREKSDSPRVPTHLVEEMRFWVEEGSRKCNMQIAIIRLSKDHHSQIVQVCRKLVARGRYDTACAILSYVPESTLTGLRRREIQQLRDNIDRSRGAACLPFEITSECILPSLSHPRNINSKQYDCFIWHSDEDADWVYYSLLPRLEDYSGYRCCVPIRDMLAANCLMELPSSVDEAACVLVILTSTFCKDEIRQELVNSLVKDTVYTVIPLTREDNFIPSSLRHPKIIPYYNWERLLRAVDKACGLQ